MSEMIRTTIALEVDADLAQAYRAGPIDDQSKLGLPLNLWLRELLTRSTSLAVLMDDASDRAEERGLTAEKLEDLLHGG